MKKSIVQAIGLGIFLTVLVIMMLYYVETAPNYADTLKQAPHLTEGKKPQAGFTGPLAIRGHLTTDKPAFDPDYLPFPNTEHKQYAILKRSAEMYVWHQSSQNSARTTPQHVEDYHYQAGWDRYIPVSSSFFVREGHTNPEKWPTPPLAIFVAEGLKISGIPISMGQNQKNALSPSQWQPLTLSSKMLPEKEGNEDPLLTVSPDSKTLYYTQKQWDGTDSSLTIGDMRFSYEGLEIKNSLVVLGNWDGATLSPICKSKFYPCFLGIYEGDFQAFSNQLNQNYHALRYAARIFSALVLWLAFYLILKPFFHILQVIPFFGSFLRIGLGILCLAASIISVAMMSLFFNFFWVILVVVLSATLIPFFRKKEPTSNF